MNDVTKKGLTANEAKERLAQNGANDLRQEKPLTGITIFFRQFKSPLVLILVAASAVSYVLGDTTQVVLIVLMVLMSSTLSFIQEYRGERALNALKNKLTRFATVVRSGKTLSIDTRELVVGDLVMLELGMVVGADLELIEVNDLSIDESMLTGESVPVSKTTTVVTKKTDLPQNRVDIAFMGTNVVQGSGSGIVIAVGMDTQMGRTAALLGWR